ncbi:hypothetical protein OAN307_63p00050 (plasmid) [Octadecabacter antarcticus 307]|uniref:Uncharacterized protein n=1 Tax=Octadecabacter antarcticus 307 TaxID=391626 RepID=M9RC80_9RHOB|nr:hypothetical protein OAN307_63p00050 [Octadecabacter antarcticus 307]
MRSATHRRGSTSKPSVVSERLIIWTLHRPSTFSASRSLGPAYADLRLVAEGALSSAHGHVHQAAYGVLVLRHSDFGVIDHDWERQDQIFQILNLGLSDEGSILAACVHCGAYEDAAIGADGFCAASVTSQSSEVSCCCAAAHP